MNSTGTAAEATDTAPSWVRQAQADRYLCRCGQQGITVWAGSPNVVLCGDCLDKRQGR